MELAAGRPSGGFGPSALTWADIAAWAALTDQHPTAWEVSILRRLDGVYLEAAATHQTGKRRSGRD